MGQKWNPICQSFKSDANLASSKWFLVALSSGGADLDVCGAGALAIGALTDVVGGSNTDTKYVDVQVGGVIKVIAGAALTDGTLVMSDASGEATTATTGNYAIGICLQDAADGELASVLWAPSYYEEG
jgi:hypothetical protein